MLSVISPREPWPDLSDGDRSGSRRMSSLGGRQLLRTRW